MNNFIWFKHLSIWVSSHHSWRLVPTLLDMNHTVRLLIQGHAVWTLVSETWSLFGCASHGCPMIVTINMLCKFFNIKSYILMFLNVCTLRHVFKSLQFYFFIRSKYITILCTISLAISYVSHLHVLIFVQCRTLSNVMTKTGS